MIKGFGVCLYFSCASLKVSHFTNPCSFWATPDKHNEIISVQIKNLIFIVDFELSIFFINLKHIVMIKNTVLTGLTFFFLNAAAQNFIGTYSFSSVSSTTGLVDPSVTPLVQGLVFGSFKATGVSVNPSASGRF